MRIDLPKAESAKVQRAKRGQSSPPVDWPEKYAGMQSRILAPKEQVTCTKAEDPRGGDARLINAVPPVDLSREGANMLELQTRQSMYVTPLSISSKAAQAVLGQF